MTQEHIGNYLVNPLILYLDSKGIRLFTHGITVSPIEAHNTAGVPITSQQVEMLVKLSFGIPSNCDSETTKFIELLNDNNLLNADASAIKLDYNEEEFSVENTIINLDGHYNLAAPIILGLFSNKFKLFNHDGSEFVSFNFKEVLTIVEQYNWNGFQNPLRDFASKATHLNESEFLHYCNKLFSMEMLLPCKKGENAKTGTRVQKMIQDLVLDFSKTKQELEKKRASHTYDHRVTILNLLQPLETTPPLALGMLAAYARKYKDGYLNEFYDLEAPFMVYNKEFSEKIPAGPKIALFSNYIWNHKKSMITSRAIKNIDPNIICIHGGPDTPSYEKDVEAFFAKHKHVDIAVHGEGEQTYVEILDALKGSFLGGPVDLSPLINVPGLSFRRGNKVFRTGARTRLQDLDILPSPYTEGVFDFYMKSKSVNVAIIETNRGCPYKCTFCDWGSATNSKIKKFELERIFKELEWCAKAKVPRVFVADANFGIFARDVEITAKVVELYKEYGFPFSFQTNYAKNNVKYLKQIVQLMTQAGIMTEGLLSLQSMDENTLNAIDRHNIKLAKYDELAKEFRKAGLPLYVDLMIGLPGQSAVSFQNDLQECVNREVWTKIFQTQMLVNSPMNNPEYKKNFAIETIASTKQNDSNSVSNAIIVSSSTFSELEYIKLLELRQSFLLTENFGILRHITRYVRAELNVLEMDTMMKVRKLAIENSKKYPITYTVFKSIPYCMTPPVSWKFFMDELRYILVEEFGISNDDALDTVLTVQLAHIPSKGRKFPLNLNLKHDYTAWYKSMIEIKDDGHLTTWQDHLPKLRTFKPQKMVIEDFNNVCKENIGIPISLEPYLNWELTSDVSRPTHSAGRSESF